MSSVMVPTEHRLNFQVPMTERASAARDELAKDKMNGWKKQGTKLRAQKRPRRTRHGAAAASLVARMAELRQGFVEVIGQERHAEQI